jgi:cell division septation protein DedD
MGLFVGQNYLLDAEKPEDFVSKTVGTELPTLDLKTKINDGLQKLKDKFFANDEASLPDPKNSETLEDLISDNDQTLKGSQDKKEVPKLSIKKEQTQAFDDKSRTQKPKQEARPVIGQPTKPKTTAQKPVKNVTEPIQDSSEVESEGTSSGWVIQVAAFQDLSDARKVEQDILKASYPSYIYKAKINGNTWYRINVGPFDSVTDATNFKQSQKVHTKFKGAFVRKL